MKRKQKKPSKWQPIKGWVRVKTKKGFSYKHKGRKVSERKFKGALQRAAVSKIKSGKLSEGQRQFYAKQVGAKKLQKALLREAKKFSQKKTIKVGNFCTVATRLDFYDQVVADRRTFREDMGATEEEMSALRVIIDIDPLPIVYKKKRIKRTAKESGRGHRIFKDLNKLKNFLGLNVKYKGDSTPVDWSKETGVCKFKKIAYQSSVKLRGERIIGEKIWRKYIIEDA